MNTISVIVFGIVGYFAIGGLVLGLIDSDLNYDTIVYWPGLVVIWLRDIMYDVGLAIRDICVGWKERFDERESD